MPAIRLHLADIRLNERRCGGQGMRADNLVAYYWVSTAWQEASSLGLDAQRQAVTAFLCGSAMVAEFTETESGKRICRPELSRDRNDAGGPRRSWRWLGPAEPPCSVAIATSCPNSLSPLVFA